MMEGWWPFPTKIFRRLWAGKLLCMQQYWMIQEIAHWHWGRRREDEPVREWTPPIPDQEMAELCRCTLDLLTEMKEDAVQRGLIAIKPDDQQRPCYRLLIENWANAPKAPRSL
jgi:hypothetical protein